MTYFSLPLSFIHPSSIVMHPPKSLALAGLALYETDGDPDEPVAIPKAAATYVVMQSSGHRAMLNRMSLYRRPVEATLYMQSDFGTPGEIRYSLLDASGVVVLAHNARVTDGIGQHGIEMSELTPGRYSLLVSWTDEENEESAVMYQIEKLQ